DRQRPERYAAGLGPGPSVARVAVPGLPVAGLAVAGLAVAGLAVAGLAVAGLALARLCVALLAVSGLPIALLAVAGLAVALLSRRRLAVPGRRLAERRLARRLPPGALPGGALVPVALPAGRLATGRRGWVSGRGGRRERPGSVGRVSGLARLVCAGLATRLPVWAGLFGAGPSRLPVRGAAGPVPCGFVGHDSPRRAGASPDCEV